VNFCITECSSALYLGMAKVLV